VGPVQRNVLPRRDVLSLRHEVAVSETQPGWLPCPNCGRTHRVPTAEALEKFHASIKRVWWGTNSDGCPVYTNGIAEDALGLSPFIRGWGGDHGYYVTSEYEKAIVTEIVKAIDWDRIQYVKGTFDVPFNWGDRPGMMFDSRLLLSTEVHAELLRMCYRSVSDEEFDKFCEWLQKSKPEKEPERPRGQPAGPTFLRYDVSGAPVASDDKVGFDLDRIDDIWNGSIHNLENMGIKAGTLKVSEDWELSFIFDSGVRLIWDMDTNQWETDWSSVTKESK
jgi:hypothetical protein